MAVCSLRGVLLFAGCVEKNELLGYCFAIILKKRFKRPFGSMKYLRWKQTDGAAGMWL